MASVPLFYKEMGSGSPLLIIHGLFGTGRNWGAIAKRLSESHRVLLLDMRNHGQSPWSDDMTYEAMASDVLALIDQLALERVSIVGHSMGGKVAMHFALQNPERVSKVVAVDIAPVNYRVKLGDYITAMQQLDLSGALNRSQLQAALDPVTESAGISQFLLASLQRDGDGYRFRMNLDVLEKNLDSEISRFPETDTSWSGPILFLDGEQSAYIRESHHPEIYQRFPKAKITTIQGAGHWLHSEKPAETLDAIAQFLSAP